MEKRRDMVRLEDIVVAVEAARIPAKDRDPKLYYYEIRHDESDWTEPVEIGNDITVNFMGTLITNAPLELTDGFLEPTWEEKGVICEKMQEYLVSPEGYYAENSI